jgi:cobalt-zinc-cadmium efflux system outer membrane protein
VGTFRERTETGKAWEQIVTFRVRIPFGSENRNRPRVTAANVELIEAQALRNRLAASVEAEASAALQEVEIASAALPLARRRTELARDTHRLFARGFAAGEFDFTIRLRAERELREAELADARAQLAAGRAGSRLKQAYGVLP